MRRLFRRQADRREGGFVAAELALGVGVLLLPVAFVVLTIPSWSERQTTGRAIAREVGRAVARDGWCDTALANDLGGSHGREPRPRSSRCADRSRLCVGRHARRGQRPRRERHGPDAGGAASRVGNGGRVELDRAASPAGRSLRERAVSGGGRRRAERGTITLWLLGLCLMLFALGGISVDLWRSFSARRALASGADAAALAGASAIDEERYRASGALSLVPATAEHRARASLDRQLDQSDRRGADVRATDESVTVVVRGTVDFTLLGLLRWRQLRHRSRGHRDASAVAVKLVAVALVVVATGLCGCERARPDRRRRARTRIGPRHRARPRDGHVPGERSAGARAVDRVAVQLEPSGVEPGLRDSRCTAVARAGTTGVADPGPHRRDQPGDRAR